MPLEGSLAKAQAVTKFLLPETKPTSISRLRTRTFADLVLGSMLLPTVSKGDS
jgi:hypothetical protein